MGELTSNVAAVVGGTESRRDTQHQRNPHYLGAGYTRLYLLTSSMSVSESITVYRCAKCGTTETTFGGIRRHIESHRSMREFFKIEEMAFMYEFTERYEIPIEEATEYRTGARGEGR